MKVTREVTYIECAANVDLSQRNDGSVDVEVTDVKTGVAQVVSVIRPSRDVSSEYGVEVFTPCHAFEVEPSD